MRKIFSYYSIPFFIGVIFYLLYKLSTLSIRLSDSNIYFVTASHLANGAILYKDIFFTNFPFHPYFSVIYFWVLGGNLEMYFFTSALEASIVSVLIFYILLREKNSYIVATISSFVYLFSVLVLITTDHQTGVFLASIFACLSYIFFLRKQFLIVGILCALMLLVKAYFIPIALTYGFYLLFGKKVKELLYFFLGGVVGGLLILSPFLLQAREEFFSQVFGYSLSRGAGIPKFEIAKFFVFRDLVLFLILALNLALIRKRLFWGLFSIFSFVFFIFYQDIYYLYLNFTAPFAAISFPYIYRLAQEKTKSQPLVIPTILGALFLWNVYVSYSDFFPLGRIGNISEIVSLVKGANPEYIYGNNDIAPAVSYLSGTPQLDGIVDTNENMFRTGVLDASDITDKIFDGRTLLVLHSAYYPLMGIESDTFSEIVEGERIRENCTLLRRFPVVAEGITNALAVFKCW